MTDSHRKIQAVVVRTRNGGEVLLLHYAPPKSYWENITGNINEHETFEKGLERELQEEVSLERSQIIRSLRLSSFEYEKNGIHYVEHIFMIEVGEDFIPDITKNPDMEHDAYGWFESGAAGKLLQWPNMREAVDEALKKLQIRSGS